MCFPPHGHTILNALSPAVTLRSAQLIQPLWKGYGHIWRLFLNDSPVQQVIVKHVYFPPGHTVSHQRKVRSYQIEQMWYLNWNAHCSAYCRVPHMYTQRHTDHEHWLLLEDLTTSGFQPARNQLSQSQIEAVLSWLAHFHATFMGVSAPDLWPIGSYWHWQTRQIEWKNMPEHPLKRGAALIDQQLQQAQFQTLIHGDAKPANFSWSPDQAAAVDFQYVGRGPGIRDVAYFLNAILPEQKCAQTLPLYLDIYFDHLKQALNPQWDKIAIETEWRALFPWAWIDFYRFELGWTDCQRENYPYSEGLTHQLLAKGISL